MTEAGRDIQSEGKSNFTLEYIRSTIKAACQKEKELYGYKWRFI
jgi:hypothetical protein